MRSNDGDAALVDPAVDLAGVEPLRAQAFHEVGEGSGLELGEVGAGGGHGASESRSSHD